jgi:LytS/YehU family sensor histidine kinase
VTFEAHGGIGLGNVRERLSVHFGERATLTAGAGSPGKWITEIGMALLREGADAG